MRSTSLPVLASAEAETVEAPLLLGDCLFVILLANALLYGLGYGAVVGVRALLGF